MQERRAERIGATEPERITVNIAAHATLRRCQGCRSYWIENEREAHAIGGGEAQRTFPDAFASNDSVRPHD